MEFNWDNVKEELEKYSCSKSVLLGNGFSIACINDNNFNQENIINTVRNTFKNRKAIKGITNIEDYISEVEKQFIKQLYEILPEEKIKKLLGTNSVTPFLDKFDSFYTLNYDHVLYYLLIGMLKSKHITDGFGGKDSNARIWNSKNDQCVYYLHGAFHLKISDNGRVEKITRNKKSKFFEKIREEWDKGVKSHLVIASDYKTKELKLTSSYSPYLSHCFKTFKQIGGILVTHGVSFSKSDKHIIDAINKNNNLQKIYLGYFKDDELAHFKEIFDCNNKVKYFCTKNMFTIS